MVHLCGNEISEIVQNQINTRLKPKNQYAYAIMNEQKRDFIDIIGQTVKKEFYKRHELIYDAV